MVSVDREPVAPAVFAIQQAALLLAPPLVLGAIAAAASGLEDAWGGVLVGAVVGVGAAKLRNELRGMRAADRE